MVSGPSSALLCCSGGDILTAGELPVKLAPSRGFHCIFVGGKVPSVAELYASACMVAVELCPVQHRFLAKAVLYRPGWTDTSVLQMSLDL